MEEDGLWKKLVCFGEELWHGLSICAQIIFYKELITAKPLLDQIFWWLLATFCWPMYIYATIKREKEEEQKEINKFILENLKVDL